MSIYKSTAFILVAPWLFRCVAILFLTCQTLFDILPMENNISPIGQGLQVPYLIGVMSSLLGALIVICMGLQFLGVGCRRRR